MIASTEIGIADYHASEYVSHSKLKVFAELGPFAYRSRFLLGENRQEVTEVMRLGQAVETYLQDPDVFRATYSEAPAIEGKADDALLAEALSLGVLSEDGKPFSKRHGASTVQLAILRAKGGDVLTRSQMERIERMAQSFDRNRDARALVAGMTTQVTLRDDFAGLDILPGIQSRPDWYHAIDGDSVDLKCVESFAAFDKAIGDREYAAQAALIDIITGSSAPRTLIALESTWPFRCQVVDLAPAWVDLGHAWVQRQLAGLRECYTRNEWPLCETRRTSYPPAWRLAKEGL